MINSTSISLEQHLIKVQQPCLLSTWCFWQNFITLTTKTHCQDHQERSTMTKSPISPKQTPKKSPKINLKELARMKAKQLCCLGIQTTSSSSSPSISISSPIREPEETLGDILRKSQSPKTPPPTKTPIATTPPPAPTHPPLTNPRPITNIQPVELFQTPPTSPNSYLESLEDLPPRPSHPPPLSLDNQALGEGSFSFANANFTPSFIDLDTTIWLKEQLNQTPPSPIETKLEPSFRLPTPPPPPAMPQHLRGERKQTIEELDRMYAF